MPRSETNGRQSSFASAVSSCDGNHHTNAWLELCAANVRVRNALVKVEPGQLIVTSYENCSTVLVFATLCTFEEVWGNAIDSM